MLQSDQQHTNGISGDKTDFDTAEIHHQNSVVIIGHQMDLDATEAHHQKSIGIGGHQMDLDATEAHHQKSIGIGGHQMDLDATEAHQQKSIGNCGHQMDLDTTEAHQKSIGIGGRQMDLDTAEGSQQKHVQGAQKRQTQRYWQVTALISCFVANIVFGGVGNSYGVLYIYMQDSLGVSEYQLSWLGALMTGLCGLASIIGTVLVETVGCRITTLIGGLLLSSSVVVSSQTSNIYLLYITLGVLPGIGTTLSYLATFVHISRMFSRWLPMATGLSATGSAVGILIWPSMISGIADIMGWRGAVLIHGAILLHLVPAALLIKTNHKQVLREPECTITGCQRITNYFRIFKLPGVINLICIAPIFIGLPYYSFSAFIPQYAMTTFPDMTSSEASLIISLVGVGNIISRLVVSVITTVIEDSPLMVFLISLFGSGIVDFAVTLCNTTRDILIDGAFYGLATGAWSSVYSLVLVKQFGIKKFPKIFGTFLMIEGIGTTSGPPLLSYIGTVANPESIFFAAGTFYIISVLVMLPLIFNKKLFVPGRKKSVTLKVFTVT